MDGNKQFQFPDLFFVSFWKPSGGWGGACIPGSLETETVQEAVLNSPGLFSTPGHCKDSRLKHTSTFQRKRPICLSCNFSLRGRLLTATHLDYRGPPGTGCHLCILHLLARALRYFLERSLYTRLEHTFVQLLPREHFQTAQLWSPIGLMLAVPWGCICLYASKAAAWGFGSQPAWIQVLK